MNNNNKNKNNKSNNQSNYITSSIKKSDSIKKYQTILIKYNLKESKENEKPQELVQNLEFFSSRYSINEFMKNEKSKRLLTPKKILINHKIPKIQIHNKTMNEKYAKTETSKISKNKTILIIPKFVQMPNIENLKKFRNNNKPIFFCQKESVKNNINLMIKNNNKEKYFRLSAMASNYWNKKNENLLLNKINSIEKE